MKRWKKPLAYVIGLASVLALCIPALHGALAEDAQTIEIRISKTTDVYGDNGKVIGTLIPGECGEATYMPVKGSEAYGVQVLYTYAGDSGDAILGGNLGGKTKVTLRWDSGSTISPGEAAASAADQTGPQAQTPPAAESPATEQSADPNATPTPVPTPTPEPTPTIEPSVPDHVWIDTGLIVAALMDLHAADAQAIWERDTQIEILKAGSADAGQSPASAPPAKEEPNVENSGAQPSTVEDSLLYLIFKSAMLVLGVAFLGWIAVSEAGRKKNSNSLVTNANETGKSLGSISRNTDALPRIASSLDTGMKTLPSGEQLKQIFGGESGKEQRIAQPNEPPDDSNLQTSKNEEPKIKISLPDGAQPDLIGLANRLAGIASADEWFKLVDQAGFHAKLLQTSPTGRDVWIEDRFKNSTLACLMRSASDDKAYLIPSFNDARASEDHNGKFYQITEDRSVTYYRIELLAIMNVRDKIYFSFHSQGKLVRGV